MTKTYDTNHQIHFKKTSSGNQLEFVKYKTKTFSDQKMMNTFLEAYELSYQQFLALADEQAFQLWWRTSGQTVVAPLRELCAQKRELGANQKVCTRTD